MIFNAKKETNKIIKFIKNYYKTNNLKGVIIGISGGKDSAVVAALFTKALGSENIIGLALPCHSKKQDKIDAELISSHYGFKLINHDLTNTFDSFKKEVKENNNYITNSDINLKPRLRMSALYYYAALYTSLYNKQYLVAGTLNKSELYVGYFTKGGDNIHDIAVLSDLTKEEVILIGEYLEVPKKVLYKTPSDGLSNKTDEDKLGVSYLNILRVINGEEIEQKERMKIDNLHNNSLHKFYIPGYKKSDK